MPTKSEVIHLPYASLISITARTLGQDEQIILGKTARNHFCSCCTAPFQCHQM